MGYFEFFFNTCFAEVNRRHPVESISIFKNNDTKIYKVQENLTLTGALTAFDV